MDRLFIEKPMAELEKEVNINISFDAGRMGEYREAVYARCKVGVIVMSKALARELGGMA